MRRRAFLAATAALPALRPALGRATGPSRIVCVGGALTECVFALGQGDKVVGVDSTSLFPAAARALPNIGYMRALPPEGVVSLHPDLLLLSGEAGPPGAVETLRASRLPVHSIPDRPGGEAAVAKLRAVAEALGVPADPVANAVAADWAAMDAPIAALRDRPRVLFLLSASSGAPLAAGAGTHAATAIATAGAVNAVEGFNGYRPLSAEAAAVMAPDAILLMDHVLQGLGGPEAVRQLPLVAVTPAAASGRILAMDGAYMLGFGPRAAHARRDLALLLHPGALLPGLPDRPWLRG